MWPLFVDHTHHKAERWERRLNHVAAGESQFERSEVVAFWAPTSWTSTRASSHLLDPDEFELIEEATSASSVWRSIGDDSMGGAIKAVASEPGAMVDSLTSDPK